MYNLDNLEKICQKERQKYTRVNDNELEIYFKNDSTLIFMNIPNEEDTLVGFKEAFWHAHDRVVFETGSDYNFIELSESELLLEIFAGNILLLKTIYQDGESVDKQLIHKNRRLEIDDLQSGEEIRVSKLV